MFVDFEELLCLSFPGFGQVLILLRHMAAKDSNSIVLTSLCPSAMSASPISELQEQQLCRHRPRDCGETASTKTQTQRCLPTALIQTFVPHRQPCCLCPLPRTWCSLCSRHHGSQGGTRRRAQHLTGSWMQRMSQLRASSSRSSWLPRVTWPGFGQVPRQHCHEKALFDGGHAMSYTTWRLPHELQFSARSLCGQRVFWLSATTKPPIPPQQEEKSSI